MQTSRATFVLLSLIALSGLGCTPKVSESEARELLEAYRSERAPGTEVQIVSLHKTDGLAEVEKGANYYTMEYELEVVYSKEHQWIATGEPYKAGEVYKETGRIYCVKTEKGWKLLDVRSWRAE